MKQKGKEIRMGAKRHEQDKEMKEQYKLVLLSWRPFKAKVDRKAYILWREI